MSQADEIRKELQKRNEQTRQKIRKEKENQEFNEFLDELDIEKIDAEKTTGGLENEIECI